MDKRIINYDSISSHGNIKGREMMLKILEAGLEAADPYYNTLKVARREGSKLIFEGKEFEPNADPRSGPAVYDLDTIDRVFLFAIGKGIQRIAKAIEELLGEKLTGGHVVAKRGDGVIMKEIGVTLGGHPVPDEDCVLGCKRIVEIIKNAKLTERDLVITAVGNGVSALCTLPVPEIPLEDIMETTRIMQIEYGITTKELNEIRNSVDQLKGGRITRMLQPAKVVNLLGVAPGQTTAVDDNAPYEVSLRRNVWLHTLCDCTTAQKALRVIKDYDTAHKVPRSVVNYLEHFDPSRATVPFEEYDTFDTRIFGVMPHSQSVVPAARKMAEELGLKTHILAMAVRCEAKDAGLFAAHVAMSCDNEGEPFKPPCAFFTSGELLVTCGENPGIGGRNQEYCCAAARAIEGKSNIVMAAVDTDGTDGPGGEFHTEATAMGIINLTGGIVDGYTASEAKDKGVNLVEVLARHDTSKALWTLGDGIAATQNISVADLACTLIM